MTENITYIDSHTEGEPTRVVLTGGPELGSGRLVERRQRLDEHFENFRSAVVLEPRGSDALVGALLCPPDDSSCATGTILFNNRRSLGMCVHGVIGLTVSLAYLKKISIGTHRIETPVGVVEAELISENEVGIENVPSYLFKADVTVEVPELGRLQGDIAWGGNWFFLINEPPFVLDKKYAPQLLHAAHQIRDAMRSQGIVGDGGAEVDHIEFFGAPDSTSAHSRNFVCCPGGAYDRSPCGTGTSAKLACLATRGQWEPGKEWVQESLIGSRFRCSYRPGEDGRIIPHIIGQAYITNEGTLLRHPDDPYQDGIR